MKIEQWPIEKLGRYKKNPRNISPAAVKKVAASIKAFGFRQPIVVDKAGIIVAGHTRLESARKLGLDTVPVHVADDLTADQIKAYRIADNRTSEESSWMNDLLFDEMSDLFDKGFDLDATGFDPEQIADMFGIDLEPESEPAADDAGPYKLTLEFQTQDEQQAMLAELQERGVQCKISRQS